jgi:hypothetical protein
MIKLILTPPHASMTLSTPDGTVLRPLPDGSYDVSACPALIAQHPDWTVKRIEE